jgi:hypothetical protein
VGPTLGLRDVFRVRCLDCGARKSPLAAVPCAGWNQSISVRFTPAKSILRSEAMAIYSIIAHEGCETLGAQIQSVYPDNYAFPPSAWFIADTISAEEVCAKLNLIGGESSRQAVVLRVLGGAGFAAADAWEWLKAKRERNSQLFAKEITTQEPHPGGPANQDDGIMAQHENVPPLMEEPGGDPSEPLACGDPPANQVTYARSRLVPSAFVRPLIIFIAGVVATLVWQSWGWGAVDAIDGAASEAICPRATGVAQDNHDMTSAPSRRQGLACRPPAMR